MSACPPCPARGELERFAAGDATNPEIVRHLDACAACRDELPRIRAENALLSEFVAANADRLEPGGSMAVGIGPIGYEIRDEIHRGSQGVVYRAVQIATRRTVAMKLSLTGAFATERQRQRFEREVELLAALRHPHVVTVYDSGVTADGRQYLAMELIEGRPLDDWATAADIATRLDCFVAICDGVSAAHQRAIMHRDLKPANIIVDDAGAPHVLDFGLAKMITSSDLEARIDATYAGEFVGTLAYAAPEQVAGDPSAVDTRTDVYALGVILYELLADARPYELRGSIADIVNAIERDEPAALPGVDADLDAIVRTALAKTPDDRYASVAELAADVRRARAGEPIVVRRDDVGYLLRRVARRYRGPLTIAASFVVLTIVAAIVAASLYASKVRAARRTATAINGLVSVIEAMDRENPEVPLAASSVFEVLERSSAFASGDLDDQPEVAAPIHRALGLAFMSRSDWDRAERHLESALDAYRVIRGDVDDEDLAQCLHNLARLRWKTGRYDAAAEEYDLALAMARRLQPDDHPWTARTMQHLASTRRMQGRLSEAEELFRASIAMRERLFGSTDKSVANGFNGLGNCLYDSGRTEEALACFQRAHDTIVEVIDPQDWRAGRAANNIARCLIDLDRPDEADLALNRAIVIKMRDGGPESLDMAASLHEQARLRLELRGGADAEAPARRALAIRTQVYGERPHPAVAESLILIGRVEAAAGEPTAEATVRSGLARLREGLGPEHWRVAAAEIELVEVLFDAGRRGEAAALLAHAGAILRDAHAPDSPVLKHVKAVEARITAFPR